MKIGIVGSRDFKNTKLIKQVVASIYKKYPDVVIVSGGARGPDTIAATEAKKLGMQEPIIFPAEWNVNGVVDRGAGMKRNSIIVENSDMIIAFYTNTNGTKDTIQKTIRKGKSVFIYSENATLIKL